MKGLLVSSWELWISVLTPFWLWVMSHNFTDIFGKGVELKCWKCDWGTIASRLPSIGVWRNLLLDKCFLQPLVFYDVDVIMVWVMVTERLMMSKWMLLVFVCRNCSGLCYLGPQSRAMKKGRKENKEKKEQLSRILLCHRQRCWLWFLTDSHPQVWYLKHKKITLFKVSMKPFISFTVIFH